MRKAALHCSPETYRTLLELDYRCALTMANLDSPAYVQNIIELADCYGWKDHGKKQVVRDGYLDPEGLWTRGVRAILGDSIADRMFGLETRIVVEPGLFQSYLDTRRGA